MIKYLNTAKSLVSKNSSDLLLLGGVLSILGGSILAIKQTPKAIKLMDKKKEMTKKEKIKTLAPVYMTSILLTGTGIAQIICSRNITKNKIAAITTAYTVSETAYKTYRDKVKEIIDTDKYEEIQKEIIKDTVNKHPSNNKETIDISGNKVLIYDSSADRYFEGTLNEIDKAVNTLNKKLRNEMTISLNEFYTEIGLRTTTTGKYLGWRIDKDEIEIYTNSGIAEDGRPYILLELSGMTSI